MLFSVFIAAVLVGFIIYISLEVARYRPNNLISLCGLIIYVALLFMFSANPAKVGKQCINRMNVKLIKRTSIYLSITLYGC